MSLDELKKQFLELIAKVISLNELENLRIKFLGKSGEVTKLLRNIVNLSIEEKKTFGSDVNLLKIFITNEIDSKKKLLEEEEIKKIEQSEYLDITLPYRDDSCGFIHPMSKVTKEIEDIFTRMGFVITDGPEIDTDWYCFEGPNIPKNHPARQMQDTFYLNNSIDEETVVLRTQTTTMEIREMSKSKPPFKFISNGKTFRREMDSTHSPMFHQCEGVYVDKNITLQDLKDCLFTFMESFFAINNLPIRIRPSYFPFTSPSIEIDVKCNKQLEKIVLGEGNDWIEVVGAGMLHPNVLRNVNIDPEEYQGFAFGFGIERMLMLKYGVRDIRNLYEGDMRFLEKYGFKLFKIF